MKATTRNINPLGLLLFLQCVIIHVTAEECNVCKGTYDIPAEFEWKEIVGGKICREVGWEAMFINADDEKCLTDYNLVGYTFCGCEPPTQASTCSLCMDGSAPLVSTSPFDNEGFYTCGQINNYLLNFPQNPDTCNSYHQQGIDKCGCPDMMTRNKPSAAPVIESPSTSNKPSAAPVIASDDDNDVNPRVAPAIGIGVGSAFIILLGGLFALKKKQRGRGLKRGLDASDMSKVEFIPTVQTRSDKMGLESIEVFPEIYPYDDEEDGVPDSVPSDTLPTMQSLKKNNGIVRSMVGYDDSSSEEDEEDESFSDGSLPFDEDEKHKHPMNVRRSPSVSNTIDF